MIDLEQRTCPSTRGDHCMKMKTHSLPFAKIGHAPAWRLSNALALRYLRGKGWTHEDLLTFSDAVVDVVVRHTDDDGLAVTVALDESVNVPNHLMDRLPELAEQYPLFVSGFRALRAQAAHA